MMVKFDPSWLPPVPNIDFEQELWEVGLERVCGFDEAGRGALAGPVTAAALILPPDPKIVARLKGSMISKTLSAAEKSALGP